MKIKTSIITFVASLLVATSAFAVSSGTYDITTSFDGWTDPVAEGAPLGLTFTGWDTMSNTFVKSQDGSTIKFNSGASAFGFQYGSVSGQGGFVLNVILRSLSGGVLEDPTSYITAKNTFGTPLSLGSIGSSSNTINVDLPQWGNLMFYIKTGFEELVTIDSLAFSHEDGSVVIDNFGYNPVPIPGAVWLLGSGLVGLVGLRRRFRS